ncbi:hypothetical protein SCHPADRAFT_834439 [Schizopora paradoxa]|uniref:Mitochondrial K+-H+ exchange-related-domain-containing protein n=1 Tax=Schizopora paradoxa TaxID=27342 RepID=A0A0H2RC54_9AGAM|nr:hypothetical protein SCHPADRAFT_834439 [Schizopora paradoxa]
MSAPRAAVQRMRILALPLTSHASSSGRHIYYHFQTPSRPGASSTQKPGLVKMATTKAAEMWAGFGKAPEGSWKQRLFVVGERAVDRIDFQELALKSMDPSLGPKISNFGSPDVKFEEKPIPQIPLVHPTKLASKSSPLVHLEQLLEKRIPSHRKGFYLWMLVSPLTAPFMIIPIIPNIPFFFCVWRSWHHYRAYKASSYLESLLKQGAIIPEANTGLDKIYENSRKRLTKASSTPDSPKSNCPDDSQTTPSDQNNVPEELILDREAVPHIVSFFDLPSSAESDLYRALDQTSNRLSNSK